MHIVPGAPPIVARRPAAAAPPGGLPTFSAELTAGQTTSVPGLYANGAVTNPINDDRLKKISVSLWVRRISGTGTGSGMGCNCGTARSSAREAFFARDNASWNRIIADSASGTAWNKYSTHSGSSADNWSHDYYVIDTTHTTAAKRFNFWRNGIEISGAWIGSNIIPADSYHGWGRADSIFYHMGMDNGSMLGLYLYYPIVVVGHALPYTNFGTGIEGLNNAQTGDWKPKVYDGPDVSTDGVSFMWDFMTADTNDTDQNMATPQWNAGAAPWVYSVGNNGTIPKLMNQSVEIPPGAV